MSTVSSKDSIEDLDLNDEFYVIKKDGETRTSHKVDGKAMAALFRPTFRILQLTALAAQAVAANGTHKLIVNDANSQNLAPVTLNDDKTVITLPAGKLYKVIFIPQVESTGSATVTIGITSNPAGGAVRAIDNWENTPLFYYTAGHDGLLCNYIDLTSENTAEEVCVLITNNGGATNVTYPTSTLIIEEYN